MAVGERIYHFRLKRNLTQKELGQAVGFPEKSADIRIAQYESGDRVPRADVIKSLAYALGVSPHALDVPDIDSFVGLMHTLFALEDMYGLGLYKGKDDLPVLSLHPSESSNPVAARKFSTYLDAWLDQAEKFRNGEITREEYDKWRYEFPKHDTSRRWVQIPSILDLLFNDQTPVKPQRPVRQRAKRKKDDTKGNEEE